MPPNSRPKNGLSECCQIQMTTSKMQSSADHTLCSHSRTELHALLWTGIEFFLPIVGINQDMPHGKDEMYMASRREVRILCSGICRP